MAKDYILKSPSVKPKRVTLTKAQVQSELGQKLIKILTEFTGDGLVTDVEAKSLLAWISEHDDGSIYSITRLKELLSVVLEDGKLDSTEEVELFQMIKRIIPMEARESILQARANAAPAWAFDPATERQLDYIAALGGTREKGLTKGRASQIIDELLAKPRPPSNRQMMVLRFWDRLDLASGTVDSVGEWMDEHYASDPRHRQAWERYKEEAGDDGSQGNPDSVPIGIGKSYMGSIISDANPFSGPSPGRSSSAKSGCSATTVVVLFLVLTLALLAAALNYDKTLWPKLLDYLAGAWESRLGR